MHPTQKFVRRHQHDWTSAQVRTQADLVSHHSQKNPEQQVDWKTMMHSELLAQIVCLPQIVRLFVEVSHSILFVLVFCDVTDRCVRMSNRHMPIISVPGFHRHISCTSLYSSSFPLFHSLCLSDSVFVRIHPCFSRQGKVLSMILLIRSRHSSLCGFVALPCDASAAQPGQPPVCP